MKKIAAALLSTLSLVSAAHANTVYSWHGDNNLAPYNVTLQIDLTDDALATGTFKFDSQGLNDTGLARFFYTYPGDFAPVVWVSGQGRDPYFDVVRLDLTFGADGALSGTIDARNFNSEIGLTGTSGRFTIDYANSDATMLAAGCVYGQPCSGGTGTVTWYSYTVPEPGSLALIGLGLVGLGSFARRKPKA